MRALLLLFFPSAALAGLPAAWFVDAALHWRREGGRHAWFGNESDNYIGLKDGGSGTPLKELLPEVFALRHAHVALKAVPEERQAQRAVLAAHRAAVSGEDGRGAVLETKLLRRALKRVRGREVPVDASAIPEMRRPGRFEGKQVGLGLASCDVAVSDGRLTDCSEAQAVAWGKQGEVVAQAIHRGVRHLDSAFLYGSDATLGAGWRASGVPREELFLTTKLIPEFLLLKEGEEPADYVEGQLEKLQTDYVDALLVHHDNRKEALFWKTWRRMEELQQQGKVRALGVSDVESFVRYKRCVKAGKCRRQRVIFQFEVASCSKYAQQLHSKGFLQVLQDDDVELVQHTAGMCKGEPFIQSLSKELSVPYYATMLSWMQYTGAATLYASHYLEHIVANTAPPVEMDRDQIAGLWGLSLIYGLTYCEGGCERKGVEGTPDGSWCPRGKFAEQLLFDPLGLRDLFEGTAAPCVGKKPEWAEEEEL